LSFIGDEAAKIIENLPEALLILNEDGELLYLNQAVQDLTGFLPDELQGQHVSVLMPSSPHRRVDALTWLSRWSDNPDPSELRYLTLDGVTKSGEKKKYRVRVSSFDSETGYAFLVLVRDVTDAAARSRRIQHKRLITERIFAMGTDGVLSIDEDQTIQSWNTRAEQIFGFTKGEILGQRIDKIIPSSLHSQHRQHIVKFLNSESPAQLMGQRGEIQGLHKNGHAIPLEASITKTPIEGRIVLSAQVRDISDRKEIEKKLRESEMKFRALFEHAFEAMALLAVTGSVMEINSAARQLLPDDDDVTDRYFWDLNWWSSTNAEDVELSKVQVQNDIRRVFDAGIVRFRIDMSTPQGLLDIDFSLIPIVDDNNVPFMILAEGRDLTALCGS